MRIMRMRSIRLLAASMWVLLAVAAYAGGQLRFCLRAEPKTLQPNMVSDEPSETVQYLTAGVLIRINRGTQEKEPELAVAWDVAGDGKSITFRLRQGVRFSDGTVFDAQDVAYTFEQLMAPDAHSPMADSFRSPDGEITTEVKGKYEVALHFPAPIAGVERLFDQVAIVSSRSPLKEKAVLGPFVLTEHRAGVYVLLKRNPHYWKKDKQGTQLPYLDSIRMDIQQNPEIELMRFRRRQLHLINSLTPEYFSRLSADPRVEALDLGPSLDAEFLWFNQVARAPIPDYKKAWFRSREFRRAISHAISRDDLCRIAYHGHASPGVGPVSPANQFWFNKRLKPHAYNPAESLRELQAAGFRKEGESMVDADGHPAEFSLITNAGNRARERMAALIQEDLRKVGVRLNVVTLDFPSLIERITRSFDYEACLLGFVNVDLDPSAQSNVWLSSASQHPWNPRQKSPETPWEAEIDKLVLAQAASLDRAERKRCFDRVQEIVWEEAPLLYLVHRNALAAVSRQLENVTPSILRPQVYWNVEHLSLGGSGRMSKR